MIYTLLTVLLAGGKFAHSITPQEYDYVIIGSGPGGGPLAWVIMLRSPCISRLTDAYRANLALSGASVFLIEAGGDASSDIVQRIPARCVTSVCTTLCLQD